MLTGIAKLPYELTLSTLIQLGTGLPYTIIDESGGTSAQDKVIRRNGGRDDELIEFRQVDLRVGKDFLLGGGHRIGAFIECFNVFDSWNFGGQNGFIPFEGENADFGRPTRLVGPPRAFQLGAQYNF